MFKTDLFRKSVFVYLGHADKKLCLVVAFIAYMALRGLADSTTMHSITILYSTLQKTDLGNAYAKHAVLIFFLPLFKGQWSLAMWYTGVFQS